MRDLSEIARTWWNRTAHELPDSKVAYDPHVISLVELLLNNIRNETIEECAHEAAGHSALTSGEEMLRNDIVDGIRSLKGSR